MKYNKVCQKLKLNGFWTKQITLQMNMEVKWLKLQWDGENLNLLMTQAGSSDSFKNTTFDFTPSDSSEKCNFYL